jgi:hypothetical protein
MNNMSERIAQVLMKIVEHAVDDDVRIRAADTLIRLMDLLASMETE